MIGLIMIFGICAVIGIGILIWLYSKPGKRWLASFLIDMDVMAIFFGAWAVAAALFALWLRAKKGNEWLASL